MKNSRFFLTNIHFVNLALILIVLLFITYRELTPAKDIVYFDSLKVFENFNMAKEMNRNGQIEINKRKKIIDSLKFEINKASTPDNKKLLSSILYSQEEELNMFSDSFIHIESSKIWKRIDQYGEEFTKLNDYEIIIGSQSSSGTIYGKDTRNITDEFIAFINDRYEGNP